MTSPSHLSAPHAAPSIARSSTFIESVAVMIDRYGFGALDRATIDHLLALAATVNASHVLAEVFGDASEPAPVRERAFGLLAMQIASGAPQFTLAA